MLSYIEKEKLVIDLYYNQRKNVRQIAQEARISFRDIAINTGSVLVEFKVV
jgi:DNA-directed RNA polymerase specialized sigma subunit